MYDEAGKGGQCGEIDLYTCGFPCQPYSSAGVGRGANDKRFLASIQFGFINLSLSLISFKSVEV